MGDAIRPAPCRPDVFLEATISAASDPGPQPTLPELAVEHKPAAREVRGVLHLPDFRRLWIALSLSSLGDWLGLLATTALARELVAGGDDFRKGSIAIGGVFAFRLLPALVIGPFAGAFADRFDRRKLMVTCDLARFAVFASIPLVRNVAYLFAASFVVEAISLFWIPAKEASVPNLVPREKLEAANQLSLITSYGTAPLAAAVFIALDVIAAMLGSALPFFNTNRVDLALYFDASTFLFSALTVWRMHGAIRAARRVPHSEEDTPPGLFRAIHDGWRFVGSNRLVRGLVFGILGAFAAGGVVIALANPFVQILGGGNAGYGLLFGSVFFGLAVGMAVGPQLLADFSRKSVFGLAIVAAGGTLMIDAILPNLILAVAATALIGAFAGIAWVIGYTLLGAEVEDEYRGRTFAFVQSLVRVDLLVVLVTAPIISGLIGPGVIDVADARFRRDGVTVTLFGAGVLAVLVGITAYRQMDEHGPEPLLRQLRRAITRSRAPLAEEEYDGVFVVLEGGEGAGKSTQLALLAEWVRERGLAAVVTREPGGTTIGSELRRLLLDRDTVGLSTRAEALLYAADRAQHAAEVIYPALQRGAVVISDRYIDSTLAYQGGGRALSQLELSRLSRWATGNLVPDLTVLLDVDPRIGLARASGGVADRIEQEAVEFHQRVRETFRELAARAPHRYLVVDASLPADHVQEHIRARLSRILPERPAAAGVPQSEPADAPSAPSR